MEETLGMVSAVQTPSLISLSLARLSQDNPRGVDLRLRVINKIISVIEQFNSYSRAEDKF